MEEVDQPCSDLNPQAVGDCYLAAGCTMRKLSDLAVLLSNVNLAANQDAIHQLIRAVQRFQCGIEKVSQDIKQRTRNCIKHDTARTMKPRRLRKKTKKKLRSRIRSLRFYPRFARYVMTPPEAIYDVDPNTIHFGPQMNDITPLETVLGGEDEAASAELLAQEHMNYEANSTNFETIIKVKPVEEDTKKSVVLDAHSIPADVKPDLDYERFDHIIGG
ncbi:hypothetical protein L596_000865 [Steinernema carpocapsae]|uniref:Uncharacterized protein n=1 Tax=Steinernema carpocapsae TaxID=34508 RepID=A0A4U8UKN1_STECR|nr:hypothetical protein L596_000865 [Steinernema carpocapsae]